MLDPVVMPTLYFISVLELILQGMVFFYAYRISKITGSFRAWTMIIIAFAVLTIQNLTSLLLTLTLPGDQIAGLIQSVGLTTIIISSAVNVTSAVLLFLGFFGLVKRFQNPPKSP